MKLCESYHHKVNLFDGDYVGECWGTKECEPTYCQGNPIKCQFYPEIAEQAKREIEQQENSFAKKQTQSYFTQEEIIEIVNEAARKLNKTVPIEFYKRMFSKCN